jgi:hypothetical protein
MVHQMTPAPNRRWFRLGEPWGLLAKTNQNATRRGVATWAIIGAVGCGLIAVLQEFRTGFFLPFWAWPVWIAFGGFVGGLIEWQIDDTDDEPPPPHS